jgi:hypothetical protein
MKSNHAAAATRIADKAKRAALQQHQSVAGLTPEYVTKLRHDALTAAHNRLRGTGATPEEVVREAQAHFDASVRFLTGAKI